MIYLVAASVIYVLGGVAMTKSQGFAHFWPSVFVFIFFGIAAALHNFGMKAQQVGIAYIVVLGLEAAFASFVGLVWLREPFSWPKIIGTALVVAGIVLLKSQDA